jgi:site-specific recombinase XerD
MINNLLRRSTGKPSKRQLLSTIEAFLATYDNPSSRRIYGNVLQPFAELLGPQRTLASITPEDIDIWYQRQPVDALVAATIAKRLKAVKVFWNWCLKREYVTQSPARFLVIKRPKRILVSKAIPSDVLTAMFQAAQNKQYRLLERRDTALLAILITFGARAGEVAGLRLDSVSLSTLQILFRGKGGKERMLPLPEQTRQHVADWLHIRTALDPDPDHDYLFVNMHTRSGNRYGPLATDSIGTIVRRLSLQVGAASYGPHAIRHWRGQSLADQRVPPTIVQAILGHSDVRITLEHYYNQDMSRLKRVLDSFELGHNLESGKTF